MMNIFQNASTFIFALPFSETKKLDLLKRLMLVCDDEHLLKKEIITIADELEKIAAQQDSEEATKSEDNDKIADLQNRLAQLVG